MYGIVHVHISYCHLLPLAYDVLSNPDKRRVYDMYGAEGMKQGHDSGGPFDYNSFFNPGAFHKSHFSFNFNDFFGDEWHFDDDDDDGYFGDFFGNMGGPARHSAGKSLLPLV